MKKYFLIIILSFGAINAQIITKIESISINAPCELEYTRNAGNQNNYSCPVQTGEGKLDNYSVTVQNVQTHMNGLNESSLKAYKDSFLKSAEKDSKNSGDKTKYIKLSNGIVALSSISDLTYGKEKFKNISIIFLYRQKSFVVNLTTNNLFKDNDVIQLANRISFK